MPRPLMFDMVFLDHLKPLYTIDIKVLEEEGLVGPVSMDISKSVQNADSVCRERCSWPIMWSSPETQPISLG